MYWNVMWSVTRLLRQNAGLLLCYLFQGPQDFRDWFAYRRCVLWQFLSLLGNLLFFFLYLLEDWTSGYSLTKSNTGKTWSPSGAQSPQHHKTTLSKRKDASVHSVTVDSHLSAIWRLTQSIVAVLVPSEEANVSEFEEVFTTHLVLTWRSKIGFSYWCDKIGILEAGWMESWTCLTAAECVECVDL